MGPWDDRVSILRRYVNEPSGVFDQTPEHPSQWATIRSVGEKLGIRTESLRRWVRQAKRDAGQRPGLANVECARLKQLERRISSCGAPTRS
jgi:transposase-like protein